LFILFLPFQQYINKISIDMLYFVWASQVNPHHQATRPRSDTLPENTSSTLCQNFTMRLSPTQQVELGDFL